MESYKSVSVLVLMLLLLLLLLLLLVVGVVFVGRLNGSDVGSCQSLLHQSAGMSERSSSWKARVDSGCPVPVSGAKPFQPEVFVLKGMLLSLLT